MTEERQPNYEISDREIKLYFFDIHEVAQMLKLSTQTVRRMFRGKMIWYEGKFMISPSDIGQMRKTA